MTGVILSLDTVKYRLYPQFEELKSKFFDSHPDDPIVFHRKEIVNGRFPFQALKNQNIREEFDRELLRIITETDFTIVTVVIDKFKHSRRYKTGRYDPYHYGLAVLLERYVHYLDKHQIRGDVMAEARGGKENMRIKNFFRQICENGSQDITFDKIIATLTSKEIKIKLKSNNITGLQLADLLAHPSRREILLENEKIKDNRELIFAERIVKILKDKYDQHNGKIYGFGKNILS
jgi:hypothetical protein